MYAFCLRLLRYQSGLVIHLNQTLLYLKRRLEPLTFYYCKLNPIKYMLQHAITVSRCRLTKHCHIVCHKLILYLFKPVITVSRWRLTMHCHIVCHKLILYLFQPTITVSRCRLFMYCLIVYLILFCIYSNLL